jgi:hypothetical protein
MFFFEQVSREAPYLIFFSFSLIKGTKIYRYMHVTRATRTKRKAKYIIEDSLATVSKDGPCWAWCTPVQAPL